MSAGWFWAPAVREWAIAVCVAAAMLASGLSGGRPATEVDLFGYVLLVAGGLVLVGRRRAPIAVLVATGLCAVGYHAVGFEVLTIAYLVAVYSAVRVGHRVVTVVASLTLLAVLPLVAVFAPFAPFDGPGSAAFTQSRGVLELAWLIAAFAAGEAIRQAERRADEAERTREETARRRADEERLHIARELHDSLTHLISVIKVQAEVAVHLARRQGGEVPDALLAIREAGREATRELRATLEALRDDETPSYGIDQLPELVERARTSGLAASLSIQGQRHGVPTAVERTAYRIVQESLTNTARHASAGTASVRIDYGPDVLVIRVDDDGTATPDTAPLPGVGLLGMRERVAALGGHLRAEPRSEGGFTIRAELPVERTP